MSRNTVLLPLFALCMAACSAPPPDEQDEQEQAVAQAEQRARQQASVPEVAPPIDANACEATQAQWIVGKTPTSAEVAQAKGDARAGSVRVLKPEQAVALDFNAARLNIELDEKGVAVSVRCG